MKTLDISQILKRDHCTVKRFVAESRHTQVHAHKQKQLQWALNYMKTNFHQFCSLMSAVQPYIVHVDGVVDGHHVPTRM